MLYDFRAQEGSVAICLWLFSAVTCVLGILLKLIGSQQAVGYEVHPKTGGR